MKKILLFAILLLNINFSIAQEGKTPGGDNTPSPSGQIPSLIVEKFNREYPGVSGSWTTDGENFKVEFTDPQSHLGHIIVYDRNGDVIRRESELDGPKNPNAINEYYKKNFPGEDIKTWSVEEKNGDRSYYAKRKEELLRFNKDGTPSAAGKPANDGIKQKNKVK